MKLFRISTVPMSLNLLLKGQLKYLNTFYEVTAISGAGKDLELVKEREGVKVHPIELQRQISPVKDVVSLVKLYRYFKKERPDMIHSITPKAGLLSMIAGKLAGVPVRMHTFTGLIFPQKKGKYQLLLIWMDRVLCSCATHVYPEGNGVKQDLLKYGITTKPLKVIANGNVNGIDTDYFNPEQISAAQKQELRTQLNISADDFVFIFVGRLVGDKGINELVAAFKNIASAPLNNPGPSARKLKLLLVGPLEQHLNPIQAETLAAIQSHAQIITTGFQEDVRSYFAVSDALVFPSYREGFPNVVLQSLAMEVPAIVSDINGCREIITHRDNGLIVPAKNSTALQNAMEELITDSVLYHHLQSNSRKSAAPFEQEMVWQGLAEEYDAVLKAVK